MDADRLYSAHHDTLEDFWDRRGSAPRHVFDFTIFGRSVRLLSNHAGPVQAAERSVPLFSVVAPEPGRGFAIQVVVKPERADVGEPPNDFSNVIQYTGHGRWLAMHLGQWGCAFVDMSRRRACAVVAAELASRPVALSRSVLNTILLNFLIGDGSGLLHATGLVRGDRAIVLLGEHNTGKSTTALRLALGGYRIVSDSQIHAGARHDPLQLLGFPVGIVNLRADTVSAFPQFTLGPDERVEVRGETKYVLDLGRVRPDLVERRGVSPRQIDVCLLRRGSGSRTRVEAASRQDVETAIMRNSLYYDTPAAWRRNLLMIQRLLDRAGCRHLVIGTDPDGIVAAVDGLG